jgi:ribonucleoside-diphosphate reductase alpha chain
MISMSLRSGIKPESIIKQLQGIRTSTPTLNRGMFVYSVPDAVAKILKRHIDEQKQQIKMFKDEVKHETVAVVNQTAPIKELESEIKFEVKYEESKPTLQMVNDTSPSVSVTTEESMDSKYTKTNDFGDMLDCPDCGSDLEYAEGCILCRACGYSKCG